MDITQIVKKRRCGQIRFHFLYQYPQDLNSILKRCCLKTEADNLLEINREESVAVLTRWLHREPAYGTKLMSEVSALELAENFVMESADDTSRFFTNGRWFDCEEPATWQPLTESVFDGGLLIASGIGNDTIQVCIWFEDED